MNENPRERERASAPPKNENKIQATIYRRKGSRFWQSQIRFADRTIRRSTRCVIRSSAIEFAWLHARHEARGTRLQPPDLDAIGERPPKKSS